MEEEKKSRSKYHVCLRMRAMKNGNKRLYLDMQKANTRHYEYLGLHYVEDANAADKKLNAAVIAIGEMLADRMQAQLERGQRILRKRTEDDIPILMECYRIVSPFWRGKKLREVVAKRYDANVTVRSRKLSDGRSRVYLDTLLDGVRVLETTHRYLLPETTEAVKRKNIAILKEAEVCRQERVLAYLDSKYLVELAEKDHLDEYHQPTPEDEELDEKMLKVIDNLRI